MGLEQGLEVTHLSSEEISVSHVWGVDGWSFYSSKPIRR